MLHCWYMTDPDTVTWTLSVLMQASAAGPVKSSSWFLVSLGSVVFCDKRTAGAALCPVGR